MEAIFLVCGTGGPQLKRNPLDDAAPQTRGMPDMSSPSSVPSPPTRHRLRIIARVVLLLWVGFWLFFAIASRVGEGISGEGMTTLVMRGGVLLVLAAIAWFAPTVGGWLLLTSGVLLCTGVLPFARHALVVVRLVLGVPPILVGTFLILAFPGRTESS